MGEERAGLPVFGVLLHGRNLLLSTEDGRLASGGVYCWRFVQSKDPDEAATLAISSLLRDEKLWAEIWNRGPETLEIVAEEVESVELVDRQANPSSANSGLVFYRE